MSSTLPLSSSQLALVVLGVLVAIGFVYVYRRRYAEWNAFAARHGWVFDGSLFRMELHGQHHGRKVGVRAEKPQDNKNSPHDTVVRLDVSDVLPELTLKLEGLGSGLRQQLGAPDEQVGDYALDKVFELHHVKPEEQAVLLIPSVRDHLLGLRDHYFRFSIEGGVLKAERIGVVGTADELEVVVGPVLDLGEALDAVARLPAEKRARG